MIPVSQETPTPGIRTVAAPREPLTGYHWMVIIIASAGWLFDCMDQRIFMVTRQRAMTELLGYKYQKDEVSGKEELVTLSGSALTPTQTKAADADVSWYSGLATAIFMIGWATGFDAAPLAMLLAMFGVLLLLGMTPILEVLVPMPFLILLVIAIVKAPFLKGFMTPSRGRVPSA